MFQPCLLRCVFLDIVVVQSCSCVQLFVTPWTAGCQASLSLTISQVHVHCIGDAIQPSHPLMPSSPSALHLSQHQGLFPMNCLCTSDDQTTGASASASVLPMNIQGWSPLRLTSLISLLSKGLLGVFSNTTVQRHQLFGILPSVRSSSHNHMWPLGRP